MNRIIILGGPRTGKTTLASRVALDCGIKVVYHTDALIPGRNWADQGEAALNLLCRAHTDHEQFVYEGVLAVRALSRWLKTQPGKPCDRVIVLTVPKVPQSPEQQRFMKGIMTQFQPLVPALRALGVEIEWSDNR